jgi:hypothetical protein
MTSNTLKKIKTKIDTDDNQVDQKVLNCER